MTADSLFAGSEHLRRVTIAPRRAYRSNRAAAPAAAFCAARSSVGASRAVLAPRSPQRPLACVAWCRCTCRSGQRSKMAVNCMHISPARVEKSLPRRFAARIYGKAAIENIIMRSAGPASGCSAGSNRARRRLSSSKSSPLLNNPARRRRLCHFPSTLRPALCLELRPSPTAPNLVRGNCAPILTVKPTAHPTAASPPTVNSRTSSSPTTCQHAAPRPHLRHGRHGHARTLGLRSSGSRRPHSIHHREGGSGGRRGAPAGRAARGCRRRRPRRPHRRGPARGGAAAGRGPRGGHGAAEEDRG